MSAPAAFQATYSDWKLIRSRKVVQICLEVPIEAAGQAYNALGGMPNPASEVWVGVARLNNGPYQNRDVMVQVKAAVGEAPESPNHQRREIESEMMPTEHRADNQSPAANNPKRAGETSPASADKPARVKRSWHEMTPAQQAGVLCNDATFSQFIYVRFPAYRMLRTVDAVRQWCKVESRKNIIPDTEAAERWRKLVSDYRAWMHEPEFVG